MPKTAAEQAEMLSQRRARALPMLAILYFIQQTTYLRAAANPDPRPVDHVWIGAWVILSILLLLGVTTRGFWFRPRAVVDLIDDEHTRANRLDSIRVGFILSSVTGLVLYVLAPYQAITAREAVHVILTVGLGAAILRFGLLERRGHRDA